MQKTYHDSVISRYCFPAYDRVICSFSLLFSGQVRQIPLNRRNLLSPRTFSGNTTGNWGFSLRTPTHPQEVIDVPISLLPPYDQAQLRSGVPAANDAELSRLLEDYTS